MSDFVKKVELPNGGCIRYRLPNVIEHIRFMGKSGWDSEECRNDVFERTIKAIDHVREFVLEIEGLIQDFDELLKDQKNSNAFIHMVWDIAGQKLGEMTKKALRLAAVNISMKVPYLRDVEPDQRESVSEAVEFLQLIRGAKRLGFSDIGIQSLTARQFNLVTYLSAEVDRHG